MSEWTITIQDVITLAAIIGAITVVWNWGRKPFDAMTKIQRDVEKIGEKVDDIQQDQQKQGDMVYQLLKHAATNNNTGEMERALDEYNEYFVTKENKMKLSDRTYDILKAIYEILVLLAAFYVDIADIWNLPYGNQVQRTFLAIAAILLGLLKISTAKYHKDLNASLEMDDAEIDNHEVEEEVG